MLRFLVRAYTRTGIYADIFEANSGEEALRLAKPYLRQMAIGRILYWKVELD